MPKGYPSEPPKSGEIFGRLTVLGEAPKTGTTRNVHCRCACGNHATVTASNLRLGKVTSCGCRWVEAITRHGHAYSSTYNAWEHMHQRCRPEFTDAHLYWQRGIRVCERWTDFKNFLADMGEKPLGYRLSIDRIDNSRGYEPGNCRWATQKQQMHNVRYNVRVILPGGTPAVLAEACRLTGVSRRSVSDKIKREGITHQAAFDYYLGQLS